MTGSKVSQTGKVKHQAAPPPAPVRKRRLVKVEPVESEKITESPEIASTSKMDTTSSTIPSVGRKTRAISLARSKIATADVSQSVKRNRSRQRQANDSEDRWSESDTDEESSFEETVKTRKSRRNNTKKQPAQSQKAIQAPKTKQPATKRAKRDTESATKLEEPELDAVQTAFLEEQNFGNEGRIDLAEVQLGAEAKYPDFMKPEHILDGMQRPPSDPLYDPTTIYVPDGYMKQQGNCFRQCLRLIK